jgi:hypothetical protein
VPSEDQRQPDHDDEIPRQGFWASMPKRSLARVLVLLAMLAGIIYLRQRTGSIAGCMANTLAPPGQQTEPRVQARVLPPPVTTEKSTR